MECPRPCATSCRCSRLSVSDPSFGTIEVGKSADLLLVDGDPLKDISVTQKIVAVMARGQLIDRHVK